MLLATWQACIVLAGNTVVGLLIKILGLRAVVLDTVLNLSHKVHIFSIRFFKCSISVVNSVFIGLSFLSIIRLGLG